MRRAEEILGLYNFVIRESLISYFLVILYALTATELGQLFKVSRLIDHYAVHQAKAADLSLSEFLYMHYFGDDADPLDNQQDEALPFKSPAQTNGLNVVLPVTCYNCKPPELMRESALCSYNAGPLLAYHPSIWQPPEVPLFS